MKPAGAQEISANALADAAGVGQRSISRILRYEQDPSLELVERISRALGLTAVQMLTPSGPVKVSTRSNVEHLSNPYPTVFTVKRIQKKWSVAKKNRD